MIIHSQPNRQGYKGYNSRLVYMLESRKVQALSAMAAAEERFCAHDFSAAWMLALKARSLFPSLPGLHAAIAAYDVLRRSAAAPHPPSGEHDDWRDVLDVAVFGGESPGHDAAEARFRELRELLSDPAGTQFVAAAAAAKALMIVERAQRKFKASDQSPRSHLATKRIRSRSPPSSSDDSAAVQVESFTPTPEKNKKKKRSKMSESRQTTKSSPTKTAVADDTAAVGAPSSGGEHNTGRPSKATASASCPRCDNWLQLVVVGRRLYLGCTGCGKAYTPRCDQCRGFYRPKHVSGRYILLVCGSACRLPVLVQRVAKPSTYSLSDADADAGRTPSHVLQSSVYGRSGIHVC